MNAISFDKAYSFYPHESFEKRRSLICGIRDEKTQDARKKYVEQGWTMVLPEITPSPTFRDGNRRIGDKKTWTITLPVIDFDVSTDPPTPTVDHLTTHTWYLHCGPRHLFDYGPGRVTFRVLRSPLLKYNYTISDSCLYYLIYPVMFLEEQKRREMLEGNPSQASLIRLASDS